MAPDGDPDLHAAEPPAAFYGLWPKFADPAEGISVSTLPQRATAVRGAGGWWATCQAPGLGSA
jgi:hypothetical protein